LRFIIDRGIFFLKGEQGKESSMIVITFRERLSNAFWWVVTSSITVYLFLGIINTVMVVAR